MQKPALKTNTKLQIVNVFINYTVYFDCIITPEDETGVGTTWSYSR